jgi:(4-O-methyl)-D-glucuronate---lignin esterase
MHSRTLATILLSVVLPALLGCAAETLPDPMVFRDGRPVKTKADWQRRRHEMTEILLHWQYGHLPPVPAVRAENVRVEKVPIEGLDVTPRRITAELVFGPNDALRMTVACWIPGNAEHPAPAILAIEPVWWPDPFLRHGIVARILSRGYAFVGFDHNALASYEDPGLRAAQDAYPDPDWGVVAVAAWGCSVTMNWLETRTEIDATRVALWGHSRRGKSALLAGALDERFAAVAPHQSGMAGSALYRIRGSGAQQLEQLTEQYWLTPRAFSFIDREQEMPFDQHWPLALTAPRSLYIYVGTRDAWGNPPGEQAAFDAAKPVYEWLGQPNHIAVEFVDVDHVDPNGPDGGPGWDALIDFLDRQWQARRVPSPA